MGNEIYLDDFGQKRIPKHLEEPIIIANIMFVTLYLSANGTYHGYKFWNVSFTSFGQNL